MNRLFPVLRAARLDRGGRGMCIEVERFRCQAGQFRYAKARADCHRVEHRPIGRRQIAHGPSALAGSVDQLRDLCGCQFASVVAAIEFDVAACQMRERVVAHSAIFDQRAGELLHRSQVRTARLFTSWTFLSVTSRSFRLRSKSSRCFVRQTGFDGAVQELPDGIRALLLASLAPAE